MRTLFKIIGIFIVFGIIRVATAAEIIPLPEQLEAGSTGLQAVSFETKYKIELWFDIDGDQMPDISSNFGYAAVGCLFYPVGLPVGCGTVPYEVATITLKRGNKNQIEIGFTEEGFKTIIPFDRVIFYTLLP